MAIPVVVKLGSVAAFLYYLLKGKPVAKPAAKPEPKPEPVPVPVVVPVAPAPCAAPTLANRWRLCSDGPSAVGGTSSQGDYDALYQKDTRNLICVVDNTTYDEGGDSAWVAAVGDYISKVTQKPTSPGDPNAIGIGLRVASNRTGQVPLFPLKLKPLI